MHATPAWRFTEARCWTPTVSVHDGLHKRLIGPTGAAKVGRRIPGSSADAPTRGRDFWPRPGDCQPMAMLHRILLVQAAAGLLAVQALAQGTPELLKEGQAAFLRGDLTLAKRQFERVYELEPRNTVAIAYLRRIKIAQAKTMGALPQRGKELAAMVLPKVEFRQVSFGDALESLKQQCARLYPESAPVSFVLTEAALASTPITLSLANAPLKEVLRYAAELARAEVAYEPYAIVIRPVSPGTPPVPPVGAAPQ